METISVAFFGGVGLIGYSVADLFGAGVALAGTALVMGILYVLTEA